MMLQGAAAGAMVLVSGVAQAIDLRDTSKAVVKLYVTSQSWGARQPWNKSPSSKAVCSAFYIPEGILTNGHCVADNTYIEVEIPGDPDKHEAELVAVNHQVDLALIRLKDENKNPKVKPIMFDELPLLREKVVTVGYPVGGTQISFTEGVVSRIDLMSYAHSGVMSLMVQTDAAINPGNSGGPVFSDRTGGCLGVATQVASGGQGIGYFIPAPVINQFLNDVKNGGIDGIPLLGVFVQPLENPTIRESLKMGPDLSGVRVIFVAKGSTVDGVVQSDDVLLEIDGIKVLNDAKLPFRGDSKIGLMYPVVTKQVGDEITVKISRNGEIIKKKVRLGPYNFKVVPPVPLYDKQPRFFDIGGFIIRAVEPRYIASLGNQVPQTITEYSDTVYGEIDGMEELVVIAEVFAASVNKGYSGWVEDVRVMKINDMDIHKLDDVVQAFAKDTGPYHVIELENKAKIVLDRQELEKEQSAIRMRYNIVPMRW
ncbi:MAG: trypsin-like peptidase domain-containing protein [Gammaproteobacteria bacterium]|nr:trypsin-like peptidase domain-containing protein [Gammaproteobacteria bacterium]